MELIRGKSIYSFKRLEDVLKQLPSTTDGTTQILALADTGNWILITLPYYILRWRPERFQNHSGKSIKI